MHSHRIHTVLAAGAFLTFGFASAVAVGAVPHDSPTAPQSSVAAVVHQHIRYVPRTHHATTRPHRGTAHNGATSTHAAPAASAASAPAISASRSTAKRAGHLATRHRQSVTTATGRPTPRLTRPKTAPRLTPSASAVRAAIQGLKSFVHSILTPTPGQVAQFGDLVCSAYDVGNTTKQIEASILRKVSALPLTTILPGAADYVVRTAVGLYCPGYQSRLGSAAA